MNRSAPAPLWRAAGITARSYSLPVDPGAPSQQPPGELARVYTKSTGSGQQIQNYGGTVTLFAGTVVGERLQAMPESQ
jgi:hypothetical protein